MGAFSLFKFDITLKSRGFTFEQGMDEYVLRDYPLLNRKVAKFSPSTFYLVPRLEEETGLEYFDAGIAAEALQLDGSVVSTDRAFDKVEGLTRTS